MKNNTDEFVDQILESRQKLANDNADLKDLIDSLEKQLSIQRVSCSFLNELIEKHKENKKLALDNCKKMKDSDQYPWYDATLNNELLFVFDLEDLKIRSGL